MKETIENISTASKLINSTDRKSELEKWLADIDIEELENGISQLDKQFFPEFNLPHEIPDIEKQKEDSLGEIREFHKQGRTAFEKGDFKVAEELFASALRPALSKPSMKKLAWKDAEAAKHELLDSMYHLGLIYLNDKSYPEHHAKAAAIFQYCAEFSVENKDKPISLNLPNGVIGNKQYFLDRAYLTEKEFLKDVCKIDYKQSDEEFYEASHKTFNGYKNKLVKIRDDTKDKLDKTSKLTIDKIEERTNQVEAIYNECNSFFVNNDADPKKQGLVQELINECHKQLGGAPEGCSYSIIGLGSLALGTMTPWSDLEFAILVNDEKHKEYFRNLSKLLHIKVINLGETHLRSIGIESLNNFKTDDTKDEWFWDDIMSTGFNFDGAHPHACKLPLGRQGYKGKPDYELVLTPEEMTNFQKEEKIYEDKSWFDTDKHLVQALKSVCLIEGDQKLLDDYRKEASRAVGEDIQKERVLSILQEDLDKFSLKLGDQEEGKLLDVKKNIYRLADRIIVSLSQYYGIDAEIGEPGLTAWQTLKEMHQLQEGKESAVLSKEGAQHLKEALGVATELRLNTYTANKGQQETMSTYEPAVDHLNEEQRKQLVEETFYIKDTECLKHFYYVMLALQSLLKETANASNSFDSKLFREALQSQVLYNNDDYTKLLVHTRFLEYKESLDFAGNLREKFLLNPEIFKGLYYLYKHLGKIDDAMHIATSLVKIYGENGLNEESNDFFALWMTNLIEMHRQKGEYKDAMGYLKKVFAMYVNNDLNMNSVFDLENFFTIFSNTCLDVGEYEGAIRASLAALDEVRKKYDIDLDNRPIVIKLAKIYAGLGNSYNGFGKFQEAVKYHHLSLKLKLKYYSEVPNHYEIANSYNNLSVPLQAIGKNTEASKYNSYAKKIYENFYKLNPGPHPNTLTILHNLAGYYSEAREYKKAEEYYLLGKKMYEDIHGKNSNNIDIIKIFSNIANLYKKMYNYDESIKFYQEALKKYDSILGPVKHPEVAMIYVRLAAIYDRTDCHKDAIEHCNLAHEIFLEVYKNNSNHLDLAVLYNTRGLVYKSLHNYSKAIQCFKKATDITELSCGSFSLEVIKINKNIIEVSNKSSKTISEFDKIVDINLSACKNIIETSTNLVNKYDAYICLIKTLVLTKDNISALKYIKLMKSECSSQISEEGQKLIASVFTENKMYDEAEKVINGLIGNYKNCSEGYNKSPMTHLLCALSVIKKDRGDIAGAEKLYREIFSNTADLLSKSIHCLIFSKLLCLNGKYQECIAVCEETLSNEEIGENYLLRFKILANIGLAHKELGLYSESLDYLEKSLESATQLYDKDMSTNEYTSQAHMNLGGLYYEMANSQNCSSKDEILLLYKACRLYQKALKERLDFSQETDYEIAKIYFNLAQAQYKLYHYNKAKESYISALKNINKAKESYISALKNINDSNDKDGHLPKILFWMSIIHLILKEETHAKDYMDRFMSIEMSITQKTAEFFLEFALECSKIGAKDLALKFYSKALKCFLDTNTNGINDLQIAKTYCSLANLSSDNKDSTIEYYKKALDYERNTMEIVTIYTSMAGVYNDLGDIDQVIKCYKGALANSSVNNVFLFQSHFNLATTYLEQKNTEDALTNADKALKIFDTNLHVKQIMAGPYCYLCALLVDLYYDKDNLDKAIECQQRLVCISESELQSALTENPYSCLGSLYACKGELLMAQAYFDKALENSYLTGSIYAEYAKFLIVHKDNAELRIDSNQITKYLYAAINSDSSEWLRYSRISQSQCDILKNIIKETEEIIKFPPKALAYYLLITNPEYTNTTKGSIDDLLDQFCSYCEGLQDEISFRLLSGAYSSQKNYECAKVIEQSVNDQIQTLSQQQDESAPSSSDPTENEVSSLGNTDDHTDMI